MDAQYYFASRLKGLREEKGVSQQELAAALDISRGAISYYENMSRTPDIETLEKVSNYFGVSFDFLLGRSDYKDNAIRKSFLDDFDELEKLSRNNFTLYIHIVRICKEMNRIDMEAGYKEQLKENIKSVLLGTVRLLIDLKELYPKIFNYAKKVEPFLRSVDDKRLISDDEAIRIMTEIRIRRRVEHIQSDLRNFYHIFTQGSKEQGEYWLHARDELFAERKEQFEEGEPSEE